MLIRLSLWEYVWAILRVTVDLFLQPWAALSLGSASDKCHSSVLGKTCIVTGATSGIGLETARELGKAGACVVLACRNVAEAQRLVRTWQQDQPGLTAEVMHLDLSTLEGVRRFAAAWRQSGRPLHVLVNNAGIFSMGGRKKLTADKFEEHLAVNHLAPALLTLLLLPSLRRAGSARVVNVNSMMHELGEVDLDDLSFTGGSSSRRRYGATAAYSQSKLAQVMFVSALHRRLARGPGNGGGGGCSAIDVVAVHPGEVLTNVVRTLPRWMQMAYRWIMPLFCFTPSQGARAPLFCATDPSVAAHARQVRQLSHPGGPYYSIMCKPLMPVAKACDEVACMAVYKKTLELVGITDDQVAELLG